MTDVPGLVDSLFRESAGRLVATLTRAFGAEHIDLAEEVVQDALLKALEVWPFRGVPANPAGWLTEVARNRAVDRLRREAVAGRTLGRPEEWTAFSPSAPDPAVLDPAEDDELAMIFLCCHPALPARGSLALTLRTVGGFGVAEVARALLSGESAIAQQLVRVKRRIRDLHLRFEVPPAGELPHRLDRVMDVVYLLFNEGYAASGGRRLVREELCHAAIRLADLLLATPATATPAAHALMALMLLQASRLPGRLGPTGELQPLNAQDRSRWDHSMIARGMFELEESLAGTVETSYHLEAAIAACHAASSSSEATDWGRILHLYDTLMAGVPSPVVALNRAVALSHVAGPSAGLDAANLLVTDRSLRNYPMLPAILGELWHRAGSRDRAADAFRGALALPLTDPERRFLERRLAEMMT